jgi:hypothetical protein
MLRPARANAEHAPLVYFNGRSIGEAKHGMGSSAGAQVFALG